MPIYEYRCRNCGDMRDEWHKHEDVCYFYCYRCKGAMDRQVSTPNIIMPVYRADELVEKKDSKNAAQDYRRKLSSTPVPGK